MEATTSHVTFSLHPNSNDVYSTITPLPLPLIDFYIIGKDSTTLVGKSLELQDYNVLKVKHNQISRTGKGRIVFQSLPNLQVSPPFLTFSLEEAYIHAGLIRLQSQGSQGRNIPPSTSSSILPPTYYTNSSHSAVVSQGGNSSTIEWASVGCLLIIGLFAALHYFLGSTRRIHDASSSITKKRFSSPASTPDAASLIPDSILDENLAQLLVQTTPPRKARNLDSSNNNNNNSGTTKSKSKDKWRTFFDNNVYNKEDNDDTNTTTNTPSSRKSSNKKLKSLFASVTAAAVAHEEEEVSTMTTDQVVEEFWS